jgi:hypothetical protein
VRRLLALALVLLVAGSAHAGIVILNRGAVFVGEIDEATVTSDTITLRVKSGQVKFNRRDVRWFSAESDTPTDRYCAKFPDEFLVPPWNRYVEDWKERQKRGPIDDVVPEDIMTLRPPVTRYYGSCKISIQPPKGWNSSELGDLLVVESPDKRVRIHVFASDLAGDRALEIAQGALEKFGNRFESKKAVAASTFEWTTKLTRKGQDRSALRRIVQTPSSTAFAVVYASATDFEAVEKLARNSLDTFRAVEP